MNFLFLFYPFSIRDERDCALLRKNTYEPSGVAKISPIKKAFSERLVDDIFSKIFQTYLFFLDGFLDVLKSKGSANLGDYTYF